MLIHLRPDWRQSATAIAGILSVLLVAAGLFYSNEASRKQQDLTAQGQISEQFRNTIDQLGQEGDDKIGTRLGAIFVLRHLMRDSPDDEPDIIQVLCAFIRIHAAAPTPTPSPSSPTAPPDTPSPADVKAAVIVLAARPNATAPRNATLDLSGTQLSLPDANLSGAHLRDTHLRAANLRDAHLDGADLRGARLGRADLRFVDLSGADLRDAQLPGADLSDANLRDAHLGIADLSGAHLNGAHLNSADLHAVDLSGADLRGADLRGADLRGTNLFDADLRDAYLSDTDLRGVFGLKPGQLDNIR